MNELERLERLLSVEPPADLDALVTQRLGSTLAQVRDEVRENARQERGSGGRRRRPSGPAAAHQTPPDAAVALPLAERWVYTLGLVTFGTQALQLVARVVWRTLAG